MTWTIKQHDLEPDYEGQLLAGTQPINLTGRTVKFVMVSKSTGIEKINADATVIDNATGRVSYAWQAGDTDDVDEYVAVWRVTSAGRPRTVPSEEPMTIKVVSFP